VSFTYEAPEASEVHLMGDFNDWDPVAHPMRRQSDGAWLIELPLSSGYHHYRFLVDGKPVLDPRAQRTDRDHQGAKVSRIIVG
jgi:1,4-alpha-glucan branching enzyme